ncbi:IclR family transcriptional regulator [Asanoa ishikariensis]|uniref:Transcriptional regulator, IclR family n=1 Tax=Asanoa ishikariensis TaxID=137265 RepID=A0A1H3UET6_9ACTN|nr:IclR family transcriptional regulator [Asanoa ishikariensis]SDZ60963.1 transcriptional regulator, IclR family [Asanoa ishikariensis]
MTRRGGRTAAAPACASFHGVTTTTADATDPRTVNGLERALDVLLLFARAPEPSLGVTEIGRRLGLSKAVVHRILTTLCSRQLVVADETSRRYGLGPASLALGRAFLDRVDVRDLAREPMRRLSAATDETSTLSIRVRDSRVYLDQVTPARDVKMEVRVGEPFPLHAGSSSKAFLAFLPDEQRDAYLGSGPLPALTDHTVVDPTFLRDELRVIRERGYAASFGERQAGAASVAAPVFDHEGRPVAVISVCGPVERIRTRVDELARILLAETHALSARLGG